MQICVTPQRMGRVSLESDLTQAFAPVDCFGLWCRGSAFDFSLGILTKGTWGLGPGVYWVLTSSPVDVCENNIRKQKLKVSSQYSVRRILKLSASGEKDVWEIYYKETFLEFADQADALLHIVGRPTKLYLYWYWPLGEILLGEILLGEILLGEILLGEI